jgi:histidyl-tRNA synthetase
MRFLGYSYNVIRGYEPDMLLAQASTNADRLAWLEQHVALGPSGEKGVEELRAISTLASAAGYAEGRVIVDRSVVRGLEYYTGPVFEAELLIPVSGEDGKPARLGSVGGGGRYDGLVGRFRGEDVPATGFSIGVSRLYEALSKLKSTIVKAKPKPGPVVVLVLDKDELPLYQKLVMRLRTADPPLEVGNEAVGAELYLGDARSMNAQLKYADKRGSLCAVIQGSNERDAPGGPQVVVRDLALGAELAKANKDRADYLEMRAKAQAAVPEAELVEKVRQVIARGGAPMLA